MDHGAKEIIPKADLPSPRKEFSACAIGCKVYVTGGRGSENGVSKDVWIYDTVHEEWSKGAPMLIARRVPVAPATSMMETYCIHSSALVYQPGSHTLNEAPVSRFGHGSAELENSLYVVGGHTAIAGVFPASPSVSLKQVRKGQIHDSTVRVRVLGPCFTSFVPGGALRSPQ